MRQVCCVCKILYGTKEPLDDDSETHGLCPECFEREMQKIKQYQENGIDPWKKKEATS
jgi:hypothetical protein